MLALLGAGIATATTSASYVYDANGRLRAVTNATGASSAYVYDAIGNLLHIDSIPAGQLAIFTFSPNHGAAGTTVIIAGQGFSTTKTSDLVTFNGVAATVTAATATQLTATVPAGATTGLIGVTVATNTAASVDVFTVDGTSLQPLISSVTPLIGVVGTPVTINGTSLYPIPNQSTPAINGSPKIPTSAINTKVVFPVPASAGSGKVSITTSYGYAQYATDFYVAPAGISSALVSVKKRMTVGTQTALSIPSGKYAAVLFDVTAGALLSFQASGLPTNASIPFTIYDAHNSPVLSSTLGTGLGGGASIHLPPIPSAGTYSIWLGPPAATTSMTLALESATTLPADAVVSVNTTGPSQTKRIVFAATAGQSFSLEGLKQTTSPALGSVNYSIATPTGAFYSQNSEINPFWINLINVPATGTYVLLVAPVPTVTLTAQLELHSAGTWGLVIDGPSKNFATTVPQAPAYTNFVAQAGDNLDLALTNVVRSPVSGLVNVSVYDQDNNLVASTDTSADLDLPNLAGGTYLVIVQSENALVTISFTATLSRDLPTTALTPGTPVSLNLARPGQNASVTFQAQAGQSVGYTFNILSSTPAGVQANVELFLPDGTLYSGGANSGGSFTNLSNLPETGTYRIYVDQYVTTAMVAQVELFSGATGTLTPGGAPLNFAATAPGQNVYLNFVAAVGSSLGLGLSNASISSGESLSISVYDSSNNFIAATGGYYYANTYSGSGSNDCGPSYPACDVDLPSLAGGNYQVVVSAYAGPLATMSFTTNLSSDVTGVLVPNAPQQVALGIQGQNASLTFTATAGQTVALQASNVTTTPAGAPITYFVYALNGRRVGFGRMSGTPGGGVLNLMNLPATGVYLVYVDPTNGATANLQMLLVPGASDTLVPNGVSGSFATTIPGQNVYLTFPATAGTSMGLGISSLMTPGTTSPANVTIYNPNGSYLTNLICYPQFGGCGLDLTGLATATYSVVVTPPLDSTQPISLNATLSSDMTGTLSSTPSTLTIARRGQTATLSFAGTAGHLETLQFSGLVTTPAGGLVNYIMYTPSGSTWINAKSWGNGTLSLGNLPSTGTYHVYVAPQYGATISEQISAQ